MIKRDGKWVVKDESKVYTLNNAMDRLNCDNRYDWKEVDNNSVYYAEQT